MKANKYTKEEIERLSKLPGVATVTSRRVIYDESFRKALYEAWYLNPSRETIRKAFIERGAQLEESDEALIKNLHHTFVQEGRPKQPAKPAIAPKHEEQENTAVVYSEAEIERLKRFPGVVTVTPRRIVFDLEFKQTIYDEWNLNHSKETIRQSFLKRGAQLQESDDRIIANLQSFFQSNGRPQKQMIYRGGDELAHKTEEELIEEGVLYRSFEQVRFTQSYLDMLKTAYWDANGEKSLDEIVIESGYNPHDLGRYRMQGLRHRLAKKAADPHNISRQKTIVLKSSESVSRQKPSVQNTSSESISRQNTSSESISENARKQKTSRQKSSVQKAEMDEELGKTQKPGLIWTKNQIEDTPYIHKVREGCIELTEAFFNDAVLFRSLPVADILSIYCVPEDAIPAVYYPQIEKWLEEWEPVGEDVAFDLPVAVNRFVAMRRLLEQALAEAKEKIQLMTPPEKKAACEMIDKLPRDPAGEYSMPAIWEKLGISQTAYYKYLRRERYGMVRADKALSDIEAVRKVFEYKGFKKGSRQIYMLMPKVVGRKMGLKKIRRIMRENGMESDIRTPNKQKRAMEKYLKENRKPNLLDRRFRLFRPNQIRLTDVTYLDYGKKGTEKQRAYGSASIDPVTGVLAAFVVMDRNDQRLADATLREMDNFPCEYGGKFHSDQGTLYLTPEFQAKLVERGFEQSMSRRANCWDNAPQESFFGHFKDECDYASCETLEELQAMIEGYKYYFNYERGMWDRQRMTPVEYEKYLSSLSEEEFQKYLDAEEIRYREMKAESIKKAKARAKDLGAYEAEDLDAEDLKAEDLDADPVDDLDAEDDNEEGGGDDE